MHIDQWLMEFLVCPRHKVDLNLDGSTLSCPCGCCYPVVDGIPVMLLEDAEQTMVLANTSIELAQSVNSDGGLYLDSLGVSADEKLHIRALAREPRNHIDPVVSYLVGATNGIAYKSLVGKLGDYPIPDLRLPKGYGARFLDLGCNWGRWSIAAARKGYLPIGIDPSLGAVMAARRVARQMGVKAAFMVGDARYLPIRAGSVDQVFSYSVLQHFSRSDTRMAIGEIGRVLKNSGTSMVQMPTKLGVRCLYHQAQRGFTDGEGFAVRYWSIPSMRKVFSSLIGTTNFKVDCYFGIGLQFSDIRLMPKFLKVIIATSEILRKLSEFFPGLMYLADSVYVVSTKNKTNTLLEV